MTRFGLKAKLAPEIRAYFLAKREELLREANDISELLQEDAFFPAEPPFPRRDREPAEPTD